MGTLCDCKEVKIIKVQADMGADPLWCQVCHYNFDIEDIDLPEDLSAALFVWVNDFANWVDWETDTLLEGKEADEALHNQQGSELTERVKEQLKGQYEVVFSPSTMY